MARSVRNPKIDSRSARTKLAERREPYWTSISSGCAVGYRRGAKGGTWIARMRDEAGRQNYEALGAADDARDADGLTVFSFGQAQERARSFFAAKARQDAGHAAPSDGPYTVRQAVEEYLANREQEGSKGVRADRYAAEARILPALGSVEVSKLTAQRIKDWRSGVQKAPKLLRTAKGAPVQKAAEIDPDDYDAVRSRKATANRLLTVLKAALKYAYAEGKVASADPWRKVKPFKEVNAPKIRFLSTTECVRLINAADPAFRNLLRGALLTGARYGERTRMRVQDFTAEAGSISVQLSKAKKPRNIALTDEGCRLFKSLVAGRTARDLIFAREDGEAWGASHQQRPMAESSERAKINPPANFHVLRHTYASALAMKGSRCGSSQISSATRTPV